MSLERILKCPACGWTGRRVIEQLTPPKDTWQGLTQLIATGLKGIKCPDCGQDTHPSTKELIS